MIDTPDDLPSRLKADFALLVEAAKKGERCPQNDPFGPIDRNSIAKLYKLGFVRSDSYGRNFRHVRILKGEHAGWLTAPPPQGAKLMRRNGVYVGRQQAPGPPSAPGLLVKGGCI